MKTTKFILSILACAGAASAQSIDPIYRLTFDTLGGNGVSLENSGSNADITTSLSGGYGNYTETSYASEDGYSFNNAIGGNSLTITLNGAISYEADFTITFAIKAVNDNYTPWRNILQLGTSSDEYVRIQNASATTFGIYSEGMGSIENETDKSSLSTDAFTRITLVYNYVENEGGYFTLYSDGNIVATSTSAVTATGSPATLTLGGVSFGGTSYGNALFDEVGIYNAALTQAQVSSLVGQPTASIPEPASATLSLLALAGLAVRRRRK